jgi:uncharacterized MAPEG superfamily protein
VPGNILTPAAALVVWTVVMCIWMGAARGPAIGKVDKTKLKPGAIGRDLDGVIEDRAQWKSHNYNNLMEQPTVFYAAVFVLSMSGYAEWTVWLAWLYVVLRVIHSVWQAAINTQPVRMYLFLASTLVLGVLAVQALLATL